MTHSNSFVSSSSPSMKASFTVRASSKMRAAFWAAMIVLFSAVMLQSGTASAQSTALIHHTVVKAHNQAPPAGRDFWFAMMSNYWGVDLGGKYMRIYITSANNCTAFVSSQFTGGIPGVTIPIPVTAYEISSYAIPEFWEVESSGLVENKAIHVYSNTADLTVYDMSHNAYTSDGSYIIPTIGWGTDYVVAAYGSIFEGGGEYGFDLPSTCMIIANQDNTTFEITPSADCRQCPGGDDAGDANSHIVVYPEGQTQTFQLNRGQCMQFMPVDASDPDNFDLTGTIIHSNQPVGVSGGSVCPNIPADYPYCDHVEEMIPPVRTWAETYYSSNPIQPPGETNKDYACYLFIASQPGQTIMRHDYLTGDHVECTIPNQYGFYWDELELGQKCWSNAPFLEAWYLNSATYPDGVNGLGDPAECIINPKEQYTKTVVFETPLSVGNIVPYDDYANIIVNVKDAARTLFDHKGILGYGAQAIDDTFEVFNIPHIAPSAHEVTGDSLGVGVYIYGYGFDESYAWAGSFGTGTFNSPDTIPPLVDTQGQCLTAFIHVSDSGLLPGPAPQQPQSGLGEIRLDSVYNMNFDVDPDWIEGSGADTSGYTMNVVDPTKPAILVVEVFDLAGNEDSITSVYEPQIDSIKPPIQNLGVTLVGSLVPNIAFDTLYNTGKTVFDIGTLQLLKGDVGFTIYDSIGGPLDLSPLQPGQRRLIMIKFLAIQSTPVIDSILFGNACFVQAVAVIGSGGSDDFIVTSQDWQNELVPPPAGGYVKTVSIENLSGTTITIDSEWWPDQVHFKPATAATAIPGTQYSFPFSVPKSPGSVAFSIAYYPDVNSITTPNSTQGEWYSDSVKLSDGALSPRFDSLRGNGVAPSETFVEDTVITDLCPSPGGDTVTAYFTLTETGTTGGTITKVIQSADSNVFFDLTGTLDNGQTWDPATSPMNLSQKQTATISVKYVVQPGIDTTVVDNLTAINEEGDTVGGTPLSVTVHGIYFDGVSNPTKLSFGPVPYQSQNPNLTQKSFLISDQSTTSPLTINGISLQAGNNNQAFTFTLTGPNGNVPVSSITDSTPFVLQIGQSLTVNIDFNDSLFNVSDIGALFQIVTNSCTPISEQLSATVTHPGPITYTFQPTAILSCDSRTDNAGILNYGANTSSTNNVFNADLKVVSIQWSSGAHFSTTLDTGYILNGTTDYGPATPTNGTPNLIPDTGYVPITFAPPATPGSPQTYYDTLTVTFINSDSTVTTEVIPVIGIAGGAMVTANSVIANQTTPSLGTSGAVTNSMALPMNVSSVVDVPNVTIDQLGVTSVVLTYTIPNQDLLTLANPGFSGTGGWVAAGANNPLVQAGPNNSEIITVTLTNTTPLSANTSSFGHLNFQVDLSADGNSTLVTLDSIQLFTGANAPVGECVGTQVSSQNFTLITACGDSTLRDVMNGEGGNIQFIGAATPDPVTSGTVTMKYANLGASTMTLAIYDELGNEVARPVNNVYQDAGAWQVTTDVSKLPSGTYTYRLSGNSVTGPMVISSQFVIQR